MTGRKNGLVPDDAQIIQQESHDHYELHPNNTASAMCGAKPVYDMHEEELLLLYAALAYEIVETLTIYEYTAEVCSICCTVSFSNEGPS